jgi:hypothetical protein
VQRVFVIAACVAAAAPATAQRADSGSTVEVRAGSAISLPVSAGETDVALVIDGMDVTAVAERTATSIVYRPTAVELPVGRSEVVLYRRSGSRWTELRRITAIVRQAAQGSTPSTDQSATLGNAGQLAQHQSATFPASGRRTFQDFTLHAGLHSTQHVGPLGLTTQSNFVGVTRREQALEFATRGERAPMLDLSDYVVSLGAGPVSASLGHVTFGDSRQLASSFAARGTTVSLQHEGTSLRIAAMNGSSQLGWSNPVGLEAPKDRVFGAALGREFDTSRPGALRLDLTFLDGSKLPATGFSQAAVVDAQQSTGGSVQLAAALPNDRLRITSGFSRSRFENPLNDAQLRNDSTFKHPQPVTRGARFVEASGALLQNAQVPWIGATSLTVGVHDERVDPLYGTVGAPVAADRLHDAADANISLGPIVGQVSHAWGHDNLSHVISVLTTDDRATTGNLAVPLAALFHATTNGAWFPTLTTQFSQIHQFADGTPQNGQFRPVDLPDQVSTNADGAAAWQAGRVRVTAHANRSTQDNRQPGRDSADFSAGINELTVGTNLGSRGDVSLALGDEVRTSKERDETTRARRVRLNSSFTTSAGTGLVAALGLVRTKPPTGSASVDTEERLELSQAIRLHATPGAPDRGQLFLRFGRTTTRLAPPDAVLLPPTPLDLSLRQQWTLATGLNLRIF